MMHRTSLPRFGKRAWLCAALLVGLGGCAGGLRKFPLRDAMWVDEDKRPFRDEPEEYFSSFLWDGADQMAFRPFAKLWKVDPAGEAVNVNALDEVADSSWFTNRVGRRGMSPEEARRGPCSGAPLDPAQGPWLVTGAKPNGANPGFPIKGPDGRRYMLKFDGVAQGPRATAADVIGSKIYYAAGFSTPCNEVVFFDRSILRIEPGAQSEDEGGDEVPMTEADLDKVFAKAIRLPDGRYRGSASLFLPGKPLGPFRYEGTRGDDPNDVVFHEDRRELRASYLLAGWTHHFDSREQNTLDMWVEVEGQGGYVQHSLLDFGDCFGSVWEPPEMGRRIGHSHYLAADHLFADFVTLGLIRRPWDEARFGPTGPVLGYYQVDDFVPNAYRPGYPNPAMLRMSERDAAWMARIVARMTPAHVRAMLAAGQIGDPVIAGELERVVLGRRARLLSRYLSRLSALTDPVVRPVTAARAELCLEDLGTRASVFSRASRRHAARVWLGDALLPAPIARPRAHELVCVDLPPVTGASPRAPGYLVVDLHAFSGSQPRVPARVHLYHLGGIDYRVVGLERPYDDDPPD